MQKKQKTPRGARKPPPSDKALRAAARQVLLAAGGFAEQWVEYRAALEPLPWNKGIEILELFREQVAKFVFEFDRPERGVADAADELYRLSRVSGALYGIDAPQLDRFAVWYDVTVSRVHDGVGIIVDRTGDRLGDLCDALPLAGKSVLGRATAGTESAARGYKPFGSEIELTMALRPLGTKWFRFVTEGAHGVGGVLDRAAQIDYLDRARRAGPWTEAETRIVERAALFDD